MPASHLTAGTGERSASRAVRPTRAPSILVLLALLLSTSGGALQARAAGAPPQWVAPLEVSLRISMPGGTLCANREYEVFVTPVIGADEAIDLRGNKSKNLIQVRQAAVAIEAFVQNGAVASISPKRQVSGWDVEGFDVSAAKFTLHTMKPGTTRVYFEAAIHKQYVGPGVDITVVHCKYKVTVNHRGRFSGPSVSGTTSASMTTTISGESGELSGSGTFKFSATKAVSRCSATAAVAPINVNIKGHVSETGLELTFDYAPSFGYSGTLSCPILGTVSGGQPYSTSQILGVQSASFDAEGGTRSIGYGCYELGSCNLTITAQPIAE